MSVTTLARPTVETVHSPPQPPSTPRFITAIFKTASYLTDPICKAHENYRLLPIVQKIHPTATALSNLARKMSLYTAVLGWGALSLGTALPGAVLRSVGASLQQAPFLHAQGPASPKTLPSDGSFSLLSWNICCVAGGYPITDGGVMPWSFRFDKIVRKIQEQNADINCIYETFDTKSAFSLVEKLKQNGYHHFYWNMGPRAFGVSAGIFVASKYEIQNPEFSQFPLDSLVGRTKHAAKGVFSFDLVSNRKSFARIFSTHLQHSEEPAFPTQEEVLARQKQMGIILDKVKAVKDRCVVVTGDLNLDDEEYNRSTWHTNFDKGKLAPHTTWGGDEFCARLMGKRGSVPLNLDHTMVVKGTARALQTSFVETGFKGTVFNKEALSDHDGVFSRVSVHSTISK